MEKTCETCNSSEFDPVYGKICEHKPSMDGTEAIEDHVLCYEQKTCKYWNEKPVIDLPDFPVFICGGYYGPDEKHKEWGIVGQNGWPYLFKNQTNTLCEHHSDLYRLTKSGYAVKIDDPHFMGGRYPLDKRSVRLSDRNIEMINRQIKLGNYY